MEDSYFNNGMLRENAVALTDENGERAFLYGYGHGYHRFSAIVSQLRMHQDHESETYRTVMPESRALTILHSAAQNPYTTAAGTSMTQYSAIYNNANRTLKVWPFQNYSIVYEFDVTGNRIQ